MPTYSGGDALEVLKATSRTFYIPIVRLPEKLQRAVASAYLCMRAIDEVEDHSDLDAESKTHLLRSLSRTLQTAFSGDSFADTFARSESPLAEVTLRLGEWALLAPPDIAPRVWDATAAMADRMADWAACGWKIETEADLDRYTFGVAGAVGLLLSDLWAWYDGTQLDRHQAISFGRGLQAVNILRNRHEDLARGVDFLPRGWDPADLQQYASRKLTIAEAYTASLPPGLVFEFYIIPLTLARATLEAIAQGEEKLTREAVLRLIEQAENASPGRNG